MLRYAVSCAVPPRIDGGHSHTRPFTNRYDTSRINIVRVPRNQIGRKRGKTSLNDSTIMYYEKIYKEQCKLLRMQALDIKELNNYSNFKALMSEEVFKVLVNRKQNRKNKRYRTKQKYKEIYQLSLNSKDSKIVFGTITLNDYYLSLEERTRTKLINKWLKAHFIYSILNKDYGSKNEREHYHFIGLTIQPLEQCLNASNEPKKSKKGYYIYELQKKDYKLGFEPTLCLVDLKENDLDKTINYLLKLNNHSTKITSRNRIRIIKSPVLKLAIKKVQK